ncbi:MAG: hypothetical protein R2941_18125 [Desulfobacterales bacterium]
MSQKIMGGWRHSHGEIDELSSVLGALAASLPEDQENLVGGNLSDPV